MREENQLKALNLNRAGINTTTDTCGLSCKKYDEILFAWPTGSLLTNEKLPPI